MFKNRISFLLKKLPIIIVQCAFTPSAINNFHPIHIPTWQVQILLSQAINTFINSILWNIYPLGYYPFLSSFCLMCRLLKMLSLYFNRSNTDDITDIRRIKQQKFKKKSQNRPLVVKTFKQIDEIYEFIEPLAQ